MAHDCCDSGKLLSVDEALARLLAKARPVAETESVAVEHALGRVVADDQLAALDVPPADNSSMDGYACARADLTASTDGWLPVAQRICAGDALTELSPGTAARIFTGALVPVGADTVIAQEHCETDGERVRLPTDTPLGANIRRRGEDIRTGAIILPRGRRIRPQEQGIAASMGLARLPVARRLRVAVFSTGNELAPLGQPLHSGQIYDSNRYTLLGLLQALGSEVIDLGRVADDFDATVNLLRDASERADVILTSGGVSVGEEDYVKAAVEQLGAIELWRIAIKPGKPLAFGRVNATAFFGLPGNPVAAFVTFCLFVRPYLLRCQGVTDVAPMVLRVPAAFDWPTPGKRREYLRARLQGNDAGQPGVALYPNQSSGVLSSACWGNGFAVIPEYATLAAGELIDFIPFADVSG